MADSNIIDVTDADFESVVLQSAIPVLCFFWAPWCGPCRVMEPELEQIAAEYAGRALIVKLDIDKNQITPVKYGVTNLPDSMIFNGGAEVDNIPQAEPKEILEQHLNKFVSSS